MFYFYFKNRNKDWNVLKFIVVSNVPFTFLFLYKIFNVNKIVLIQSEFKLKHKNQ